MHVMRIYTRMRAHTTYTYIRDVETQGIVEYEYGSDYA